MNIALDSSPKLVQRLPPQAGTGTADTLSPCVSCIVLDEPMWWKIIAVWPDLKPLMISLKPSFGADGGTTLWLRMRST